jgi:hypothetical protein
MSTLQNALDAVEKRKFPYWKLNKAGKRVSQCDADENPTASPEEAFRQFKEELSTRSAGAYSVTVYRKLNGASGGFQYDFTLSENSNSSLQSNDMSFNAQQIYQNAERDVKMFMMLERLEKKIDAIGEHILKTTDSGSGDGDSIKVLSTLFQFVNKSKAAATAAGAAGTNAVNGFAELIK